MINNQFIYLLAIFILLILFLTFDTWIIDKLKYVVGSAGRGIISSKSIVSKD